MVKNYKFLSCLTTMRGLLACYYTKSKRLEGRSTSSANITRLRPCRFTANKSYMSYLSKIQKRVV